MRESVEEERGNGEGEAGGQEGEEQMAFSHLADVQPHEPLTSKDIPTTASATTPRPLCPLAPLIVLSFSLTCCAFVGDCQHCPVEVSHQVFMVDAVSRQHIVKGGRHQRL